MAIARARLVDLSVARWYHCISRCVRQAFLLGEGPFNHKAWIENRLEELAQIFAVTVGGFDRLGSTADRWTARLERLRRGRLFGRFFAASRAKLREIAARLNVRHLVNLTSCPA